MKTIVILLFVFGLFNVNAATCTSLGNGAWDNPSTWSCGLVPGSGDTITINIGHTVTISTTEVHLGAPMFLYVDGTFLFDNPGAKLHMPCGSGIIVSGTGVILSSGVGMPSHNIKICDVLVWEGPDGPVTGPVVIGHDPLPVQLVFFQGKSNNRLVEFEWRTASELNNDYFTIEGSSDGYNWILIGDIDGAGNSTEEIDYYYSYNNSEEKFNYFRLVQTDYNGEKSNSYVISIMDNNNAKLEVFPNPVNESNFTINSPFSGVYSMVIIDDNGREVYSKNGMDNERYTFHNVDLTSGVYIVKVYNETKSETIRLIKM